MSSVTFDDKYQKPARPALTTKKVVQPSQGWINQLGDHDISNEHLDSIQTDSQKLTPTETQALGPTMNESWNNWLQPKAAPSDQQANQIEFQPHINTVIKTQPEKPADGEIESTELSIHDIKKDLHNAEIKTVLLAADILDTIQKEKKVNAAGFAAEGRLTINPETENTSEVFETEIAAPPPQDPTKRYLFERQEEPREFKENIDVKTPARLVDFGFFFNWAGGGMREISKPITGKIKSFFNGLFGAMVTLSQKEVFFRTKKQLTPEQQATELKQNQYQTNFFESLKNNARMFLGLDRKRSIKQQIETTNQQAGVSNVSYEGILDPSGQIRENVAAIAEKSNSQKSAEQLKNEKQRSLMFASKGKSKTGPGISFSADKSHNFNNAAKIAG